MNQHHPIDEAAASHVERRPGGRVVDYGDFDDPVFIPDAYSTAGADDDFDWSGSLKPRRDWWMFWYGAAFGATFLAFAAVTWWSLFVGRGWLL